MATATPHLTTGWDSDTAAGDTITRRFLYHLATTCEAFTTAAGGRVYRDDHIAATDYGRPSGYFNSVVLLQPMTPETAPEILERIDQFTRGGSGEVEVWSLWPTPDLAHRGWKLIGHPPLLIRPPGLPVEAATGPQPDLRPVESVEELFDWERIAVEGYPLPEVDLSVPGTIADPKVLDDPRINMWVGYENGQAVSIGTSFCEPDIASFTLGVTRPEARGRGHWQAHAAARIADEPDKWIAGVFSDLSRPLAERIGFIPITRFTLWAIPR